ncbi:hypothetical protein JCM11641_007461 [Rhodosporidiobolus odoratus]
MTSPSLPRRRSSTVPYLSDDASQASLAKPTRPRISIACTPEENEAIKERKKRARLRKEKLHDDGAKDDAAVSVEVDVEAEVKVSPPTQLSLRRRWHRTLRLDNTNSLQVESATRAPDFSSAATSSTIPLRSTRQATPTGVSDDSSGWHMFALAGPSTAPATTDSHPSCFFEYPATPCPPPPVGPHETASESQPHCRVATALAPQSWAEHPRSLSLPLQSSQAEQYPLTPPFDDSLLLPLMPDMAWPEGPSLELHPPSKTPEPYHSHLRAHSHSMLHLPKFTSTPSPAWQLYHAIPSPPEPSTNPTYCFPPYTFDTVLLPQTRSPVQPQHATPPLLSLSIPDSDAGPPFGQTADTLTPVSKHEATCSLELPVLGSLETGGVRGERWGFEGRSLEVVGSGGTEEGGCIESWVDEQTGQMYAPQVW